MAPGIWYNLKQWVIPLGGLAVILATTFSFNNNSPQQNKEYRAREPPYVAPASGYTGKELRTTSQPDCRCN